MERRRQSDATAKTREGATERKIDADRTRMPARRRSRGHDRRHNTSSLVHSSGGTYTRSVSLSPSLPPFSLRLCLSPELSRFLLHVCAFPPGANTVQRSRAHACTHTSARGRARSRVRVRALSPLFFSASSLAPRRREPRVLSSYSRSRLSAARESTHRDRAIY